jgi:peroxiredoxin
MRRLAAIAVAVAFAACGGTTIDGGALEDEITTDAEDRGLVLDAVDCPSPDAEEGASFTCAVTVKGQENELEVVQRDDEGNVMYDFTGLVEGPAVNDTAADEASVKSVIEAVNSDVTAICDYATPEFRDEIARGENCAKVVLSKYDEPLDDYAISIDGDLAAVSADNRTVNLKRQKNGSWLITGIK